MPDEFGGPYVTLACFCEKVLIERDGVASIIRIVDRLLIQAGQGAPEQMPQINIETNLLLKLASGMVQGSYNIRLDLVSPSETVLQQANLSMLFEGNDRAVQANINIVFPASEQGLYWVNVYFEGQRLTRVPLRLIWQRVAT